MVTLKSLSGTRRAYRYVFSSLRACFEKRLEEGFLFSANPYLSVQILIRAVELRAFAESFLVICEVLLASRFLAATSFKD